MIQPAAFLANALCARWFAGSLIKDEHGLPLVTWRGEHGPDNGAFQSRLPSLAFGTRETALLYAESPNDGSAFPIAHRITPAYLRICNPIINDIDDPFLDLAILISAIGYAATRDLALRHAQHILATGNWEENFQPQWGTDVANLLTSVPDALGELYLLAYVILDDPVAITALKNAGFDGAIHGGCGANALEPEWRIFDHSQAVPALLGAAGLPEARRALRLAA